MTAVISTRERIIFATVLELGAGFIHSERTIVQLHAVKGADCGLRFVRPSHFYKRESTRLPAVAIDDDSDSLDCPICREKVAQLPIGHRKIQIADKDVGHKTL
jgi:hypothetical protein